jgi:uncharacterized delta-60 repeat protein
MPHSLLALSLALSSFLLTTVLVAAADSDLDPTFDGDGIVTTDHNEFEQINDIVIQPDGKIVAVGHSGIFRESIREPLTMMVARYNSDGSLDQTFGNGGIVTNGFGTFSRAVAVALQTDGKIVVGGRGGSPNQASFLMLRFNADGSLDFTFGVGGVVLTSIGDFSQILDLAIQSDGKIVAAGEAQFGIFIPTLARYNTDGSLDATFDGDGVAQITPPGFPNVTAPFLGGIALQPDQKIVAAGTCPMDQTIKFCVARYNPDSSLDVTFGGDGIVVTEFEPGGGGVAEGASIQPDGKIVSAGLSFAAGQNQTVLARYNPDGSLDTSFDGDGKVTIPNSVQFRIENLALQPNGQIVTVGDGFGFNQFMTMARHNSDGSIDLSFGNGGIVTTSAGTGNSGARAVAIQTDGRIVVGGFTNNSFGDAGNDFTVLSDFALVRYGEPAANRAPVVTMTGPPSGSVFAVNTPVNFTGFFTDDTNDLHSVFWRLIAAPQPGPAVVPVSQATPGPFTTTHTFTEPGVYKVTLIVLDSEFLSGITTTVNGVEAFVVIYDPNGGSVLGGGWIDSPAGALVAQPSVTGRANFAFVAKYQNGANVPTGNAQFQFNAGDLRFQGTAYEWLVVSGRFALCRGTGTINGRGNYRFMLTSVDGDQPNGGGQDKLRIRIWSDSDGLIYDNQLNAPEFDAPTAALGGGSISIHR